MNSIKRSEIGPGEARTRQRQRRQILFIGFAAVVGGVIGFLTGFFDQGDGSLFSNEWDKLALDPAVAIVIAVLLLFGFGALPLYGFRTVDELKREHNFIAFTGGFVAVLTGFPIWAVLSAARLAPQPHAFGIWAIGFVAMLAAYLFATWRR